MQATSAPATDFTAALEAAKLEALYQFAYGLSHEINNPLANIATRAQTLLVDERDPERRRKLGTINQQAFRAHEMIADLMLFARPPALRKEPTDLAALADRIVSEMQPLAAEQGTTLFHGGLTEPLIATIDPTQIAVVLRALVQNSLEALGRDGRVEVAISDCRLQISDWENRPSDSVLRTQYSVSGIQDPPHPPVPIPHFAPNTNHQIPNTSAPNLKSEIGAPTTVGHLKLTVTDTGPGIPPHIRPHIFDPFFSGREAGRGLGLGLSKAWRIVTSHGGMLAVNSPATGGAAFTIELPAA